MGANNQTEFLAKTKLLTGTNSINSLHEEITKEEHSPMLVITDKGIKESGIYEKVINSLNPLDLKFELFDDIQPNPTIKNTENIYQEFKDKEIKSLLAIGGGSVMDTAKALSVRFTNDQTLDNYFGFNLYKNSVKPLFAVPTTVGTGSEGGNAAVLTVDNTDLKTKELIFGDDLFPVATVLDGNLISGMPGKLVASTGMDALTHAIEGYVATGGSMITDSLNTNAIKVIGENILEAVANTDNTEAMNNMVQASCSAGIGMSNSGLGLVHAISHAIGAQYDAPHGIVNAILLPYVLEYNWIANPGKFAHVARLLRVDIQNLTTEEAAKAAVKRVKEMTKEVGIPEKLREIDVSKDNIDILVDIAIDDDLYISANPRKVNREDIEEILEKAI